MRASLWRTQSASAEAITVKPRQHCLSLDGWGHPCYMPAAFILAWAINRSGLPGTGEEHHDIVCVGHLSTRASEIKDDVLYITVTPYREIP